MPPDVNETRPEVLSSTRPDAPRYRSTVIRWATQEIDAGVPLPSEDLRATLSVQPEAAGDRRPSEEVRWRTSHLAPKGAIRDQSADGARAAIKPYQGPGLMPGRQQATTCGTK
jgi:hypothetical protein